MAEQPRDYFQEGIDLFNAGHFFECHEAWEYVWNRSAGEEKIAIQGLIQAAVAILHLERGNREGAESLYAKARAKLDPLPDNFRQVAIAELRESLEEFFRSARAANVAAVRVRPRIRRIQTSA
jgi:predicted metal-dependent hydrolase